MVALSVFIGAAAFTPSEVAESVEELHVASSSASKVIVVEESPSSSTIALPASLGVDEGKETLSQRGIFFTPNSIGSKDYLEWTIGRLVETGGNTIIFDVKGSAVHFNSNARTATELDLVQPKYELQHVLQVLKENKIRGIARYIAIKDDGLTRKKPHTQMTDPRTDRIVSHGWINPSDELALTYNREIICDLARNGIEEINLDFIRYRTEDFYFLNFMSEEEKVSRIVNFVQMARDAIDECGPETRLGVSTFAVLGWDHDANVEGIGQDITKLAPLVDVVSPMSYNVDFSLDNWGPPTEYPQGRWHWLVYRTLVGYQQVLGPEHADKLRPWLQGFGVDTEEMRTQMQAVFDAGVCGFTVWNADNVYEPVYNALKKIEVPEKCRVQ